MSNVSGGGDGLIPNSSLYSDINNMKPSGLIRLLSICCVLAPFTLYSKGLSKPNIVVILADDLGYSDVGSFGGEIETPHLDALAEGGVRCSQMYNAGRCCPSRASLLTGLYQHQAGVGFMVYTDWGDGYEGTLNEDGVTLGEALKVAGYTTFTSGKWHAAAHRNPPAYSLPEHRGFDRSTVVRTHIDSYWKVLKGCDLYQDGKLLIPGDNDNTTLKNPYQPGKDFYTTDYFTDVALEYVDDALESGDKPFFLYLTYNAPHFPLEAPDEVIAKYEAKLEDEKWLAKFGEGWDEMREKKLARQKELGVVPAGQRLPVVHYFNNVQVMRGMETGTDRGPLPKWKDLPEALKKEARFRRAIYNAQIDNMDENIGRLVEKLKAEGVYENTLILFVSDNGSSGEMGVFGTHFEGGAYDYPEGRFQAGRFLKKGSREEGAWSYRDLLGGVGYKKENYDQWKKYSGWATSQGQGWASYSNSPFRKFKKFAHEGGIATPLIAHWPNGIASTGGVATQPYFHFVDIMPTLLDVAGAEYPANFQGKPRKALEGTSMIPYLKDTAKEMPDRHLFWQHETHAAVRRGQWKLVTDNDRADLVEWELYDFTNDRSEINNVADKHPNLVSDLSKEWHKFAEQNDVKPYPERRGAPTIRASVKEAQVGALYDAKEPSSSSDYRIRRLSFHPNKGSVEWVEYEFEAPENIDSVSVYWFDEAQAAASFRNERKEILPKSWRILTWKDGGWAPAETKGAPGIERDCFNRAELLDPVTTNKLRIEVQLHEGLSAAVLASRFNAPASGAEAKPLTDPDAELRRIKKLAKQELRRDVDEFNGYSHLNGNRPEFDGWLEKHNNEAFLQQNVPKFICTDEDFTEVFNYRWWMITKHLKEWEEDGKQFYVFTEFPGFPGWAANSGAIPAPVGHQFYDLRWMRDPKYLKSYAEYWLAGPPSHKMQHQNNTWLSTLPRPQSHHYTSWMIDGSEAMLKIHPDATWRDRLLPAMENHQEVWDRIFQVKAPGKATHGLYKCLDMYDANEFTISTTLGLIASKGAFSGYTAEINQEEPYKGQERWRRYFTDGKGWKQAFSEGMKNDPLIYPQPFDLANYQTIPQAFGGNHDWYIDKDGTRKKKTPNSYPNCFTVRPSLNAYMFGNYKSLGNLYSLNGDANKAQLYADRAGELQEQFIRALWHKPSGNENHSFYKKRGTIGDPFFYSRLSGDNLHTGGVGDPIGLIRETVGYTPWYFNMLPTDESQYDIAWKQLDDEMGFKQPFGMSTAEYRHDFFNEMSYGWNGRGWPFQNSVVYKAYANYLRNYKGKRDKITKSDRELLYHHMSQYVELHGRRRTIGEWYLPRSGAYRMPGGGEVVQSLPAMGKGFGDVQDYFHSTFPDMLIEDLIGFQADHKDQFTIHPLLPKDAWDYFYLGDLRYHSHEVDILWRKDWDPKEPGDQGKLIVWVDGRRAGESPSVNLPVKVHLP
ncbi:MAG: arylsulfatase [Roseibacillus sp. TMED18]|nr:MAG: arylsulfatase [Roseibacillus sp. TMED18]